MGKIGNVLAMLKLLETGRKYTVKELAERIEVTPRMIKEYKAELEKAGIYIETISGIYGGYVYNHKNNYDVSFNIKDVNILEKILSIVDEKNKGETEKLLEKIKTIVIYSDNSLVKEEDTEDLKRKYNIVSKALKENSELIFNYKNKEKKLIPHNLSFYKEFIYITGYSLTDKDLRTYNLNEINF